jgi:hypothetical protein
MKLKYLLAACTAFFLVSCSNDDELPQLPQHGDIVGLNIKDAKYIYTSGTNTVLLLPNIDRLRKTVETWNYHGLTIRVIRLE